MTWRGGDPTNEVPSDGPTVARVDDLRITFHTKGATVQALRGVSLQVDQGEILALVGESGSGKTVLSMSLLGLLPTRRADISGEVTVAGTNMLTGPRRHIRSARRRLLGAVFQDPLSSLNPTTRIGRQLTERGISEDRALENLRDAGIPAASHRMKQYPHELSGGLRQRVMIAMALGGDGSTDGQRVASGVIRDPSGAPRLIVADEPTTALDVSVQAQILALFDSLRREHQCAIVLVTHDIGVAASIADRVVVMNHGRVCEVGPAAQVISDPRHPYTDMLLKARLSVDRGRRETGVVSAPVPAAPTDGCPYANRCARVGDECRTAPVPLTDITDDRSVACHHPLDQANPESKTPAAQGSAPDATRPQEPDGRPGAPQPASEADGFAVELIDVHKTFQARGPDGKRATVYAVDSCTLRVPRSGAVALVGESGSGKTTTLRMAAGLTNPDQGRVSWVDGLGRPQLIFQDSGASLTPWLTIRQHVVERLRLRGVPRSERDARAAELLAMVGLDDRAANSRPGQLSGGQQQRAAIARAVASDPSLLICDEPVSALDASLAARVLALLEDLRVRLGVALLVVTHDLTVARYIADEVYVMYRGRIVEHGERDQIFDRPAHPYTIGLLSAAPSGVAGKLNPSLRGDPPSPFESYDGCPFTSRCEYAQDRCRVERPELRLLEDGSEAACHFAEEVRAGAATRRGPAPATGPESHA